MAATKPTAPKSPSPKSPSPTSTPTAQQQQQQLPVWKSPPVWALALALAGIFATVAPWSQQGRNPSQQGVAFVTGKLCVGLCLIVTSALSVVVMVRPVPRWTMFPPLFAGAVIAVAVVAFLLMPSKANQPSSGNFTTAAMQKQLGNSAGSFERAKWGAYFELLIAASLVGVGVYQMTVFQKRS